MWKIVYAVDEHGVPVGKSRFDWCRRKYPEAMAVLNARLDMLLLSLKSGRPTGEVMRRGWIHPERGPVFAIDPGKPALRLYCCLDYASESLVLLTVGDKKRQGIDVLNSLDWAKEILGQE
jgi:hypothetical protein